MMIEPRQLPVFAICGYSGSGKTTLIEKVIPILRRKSLAVAVVKSDVHDLQVDHPGKDSDRLFQAGADVFLNGPGEGFFRQHRLKGVYTTDELAAMSAHYDIILMEGYKDSSYRKVWLQDQANTSPPALTNLAATLPWDSDRQAVLLEILEKFLAEISNATPIFGGVLIGGKSRRMGTPKHLLTIQGKTWLENTIGLLKPLCQQVVILGQGEIPSALVEYNRLPDIPGTTGPLAGLLAGMRWAPQVSWLLVACDHPALTSEALQWLLTARKPGRWAIQPRHDDQSEIEPLLAWYDYRCRTLVEALVLQKNFRLASLSPHALAFNPVIPINYKSAWKDRDYPNIESKTVRSPHF